MPNFQTHSNDYEALMKNDEDAVTNNHNFENPEEEIDFISQPF